MTMTMFTQTTKRAPAAKPWQVKPRRRVERIRHKPRCGFFGFQRPNEKKKKNSPSFSNPNRYETFIKFFESFALEKQVQKY